LVGQFTAQSRNQDCDAIAGLPLEYFSAGHHSLFTDQPIQALFRGILRSAGHAIHESRKAQIRSETWSKFIRIWRSEIWAGLGIRALRRERIARIGMLPLRNALFQQRLSKPNVGNCAILAYEPLAPCNVPLTFSETFFVVPETQFARRATTRVKGMP
jgi:hypothetical protein